MSYFHTLLSSQGGVDINQYMDLINLQSDNAASFTIIPTAKIGSWAEVGGTLWSQATDANRPLLTSSIPTFDGSNDQLIRASEVSATTFSLYSVFRDTGAITKILLSANAVSDYVMHDAPTSLYDRIQMATGGVTRQGWAFGMKGNRYSILSIKRTGNTLTAKLNDRTLLAKTTNFAGQATLISRLMGLNSGGFNMAGGVKAVCMSSTDLTGAIDTQIINSLYTRYGLASDVAADCVVGFGDSNTVGQAVTPYLRALSTSLGVADCNLGVSGTRLTALGDTSGIARWESQIISKPYTDYVVIQYGTNDILASVSAAAFANALNTVVGGLIAAGYSANRICLCSNPYQQSSANATALNNYRTEIESIRTTYGTKYFDLLQWGRDNGGDALLSDTVHMNASYQTGWSNGVFAALTS
jgi:lysophospholipase L1-like esterase